MPAITTGIFSWLGNTNEAQILSEGVGTIIGSLNAMGLPELGNYLNSKISTINNLIKGKLDLSDLDNITSANIDSAVSQRGDKPAGKLRPKFIMPSTDILNESENDIKNQILQFALFNYVEPSSEGSEGTVRTNPLKKYIEATDRLRYESSIDQYVSTDTFKDRNLGSIDEEDPYSVLLGLNYRLPVGIIDSGNTISGDAELSARYFPASGGKDIDAFTGNPIMDPYAGFSNAFPSDSELRRSVLYTLVP